MKRQQAPTLAELAQLVEGTVRGDASIRIRGAAPLDEVGPDQITLVDQPERLPQLAQSSAAAVVIPREIEYDGPAIAVSNLHQSFRKIFTYLHPSRPTRRIGIHPAAVVSPAARVAEDVDIHAGATIGDDVEIHSGVTIHSGVRIMEGCRIGRDTVIYPNVTLYEDTVVGERVILHSGVVLGAFGFGYSQVDGQHQLAAQLGNVVIEDDVEIGACTTVDRATYGSTRIGRGTKIDNLVQIAHNCRLGQHNLICSQVGIAGSTTTGDYVVMAGQVGVRDHVHIGSRAVISAMAGIANDVPEGAAMLGIPATPEREQKLRLAALAKLPEMRREFKSLRRAIDQLQAQQSASGTQPQEHAA